MTTAAALPGAKVAVPVLKRIPDPPASMPELPVAEVQAETLELRRGVGDCLARLSRRVDATLLPALAGARQAWDSVDSGVIFDEETRRVLSRARGALEAAIVAGRARSIAAVATEGLLALDAACGLTSLAERRLSALIRLRVRSEEPELLPGDRPFLDLGAALAEAAREWA